MTCLVTGANGFIGQVLCQALQKQHRIVRALIRERKVGSWNEHCILDLATADSTSLIQATQGVATIFHLAGIAHANATLQQYWGVNVRGTENLLQAAIVSGVKHFVYFSSTKAINPIDDYGRSKREAENLVLRLGMQHGIQVCILRPALVYGPHLKGNLLKMLTAIHHRWLPPLPETGNKRSMVSVDDVIRAAILVEKHPLAAGKCFVLSEEEPYSTRKIYDAMRAALGLPHQSWSIPAGILRFLICTVLRKQNFYEKFMGSAEYAALDIEHTLGFVPQHNFYDMLPKIVQAYHDNDA